jgi:hypothetical protein
MSAWFACASCEEHAAQVWDQWWLIAPGGIRSEGQATIVSDWASPSIQSDQACPASPARMNGEKDYGR